MFVCLNSQLSEAIHPTVEDNDLGPALRAVSHSPVERHNTPALERNRTLTAEQRFRSKPGCCVWLRSLKRSLNPFTEVDSSSRLRKKGFVS